MACNTHSAHDHMHGNNCGHQAVKHEGHTDYLHDGHLHHMHDNHVDEQALAESGENRSNCTPEHACGSHEKTHKHGTGCGHTAIPHGQHTDYLVNGHLHSPCGDHCDHHGSVAQA